MANVYVLVLTEYNLAMSSILKEDKSLITD